MNKEESYFKNRLLELANTAYTREIHTYTDFLTLHEISILYSCQSELPPVKVRLFGGNIHTERKIAVFSPKEEFYPPQPPIITLEIAPINPRYSDPLCHRDFLGAILNLGIVRSKIGDIFVQNNSAYVYCIEDMEQYIVHNLKKIRHTPVQTRSISPEENIEITPKFKTIQSTVANIRLDSLISTAFKTSRSSIISYIENGKVFVNGKLVTSNGYALKEQDIVSVRGKGRFIFEKSLGETKKGRNLILIKVYC